ASRGAFFNRLTGEKCSTLEYRYVQEVWDKFQCKTMKDFMHIYLTVDVLLLADVFENFRKISMDYYKLDPAWYITSPSLAWDALFKKTGVRVELLTDRTMLDMFEKGIRGGIVQICSQRFARANNKLMPKYDKSKPSSFLLYLDANNLYGWAMSQLLPVGGFRWLTDGEVENFD